MRRAAVLLAAALGFAPQTVWGQVVIGGSAGMAYGGYGPYPPYSGYGPPLYGGYAPYGYGGYAPYVLIDPWSAAPLAPRSPDALPSCYRYGRCSPAEMAAYRYRVERLDRLAPSAPPDTLVPHASGPYALPPPTADEDIRPEYRDASVVKEEYRESGRPIDGRQ